MRKLFVIILFLMSTVSHAQKKVRVSGTITDKNNGETLIGVNVIIKGTNIGTITNQYGYYSITADEGEFELSFSYMGYKSIEKTFFLNDDFKINLELEESVEELEEVKVVAEDFSRTNIKSPQMSVNKMTSKTIKEIPAVMGEVDLVKSIQLLPGVTNSGEGSAGFNVRGGASDQNLVILDEAIVYNTSHLFGFFSVFNNDAIKSVNLYKGGIPARYGGRASSVLDIVQKDGNKKDYSMTGGIGTISSRLTLEGPIDNGRGSFLVAGRTTYANVFLALANNDSRAGFYDLNMKFNYSLNDNNRLYLSGYYGNDHMDLADNVTNNYGNISGNLRWNHIFGDNLFSNLSLIYSKYDIGFDIQERGLDWDSAIENYNLKYDFGYFANDKLKMKFGASGIYYDFNPGELKPLDASSSINESILDKKYAFETAGYFSLEHTISDRITAQYGLRYSHFFRMGAQTLNTYENDLPVVFNNNLGIYERAEPIGEVSYSSGETIKTYGNLEPRLGISYQLNRHSSLKASYNRMAQYLHLISNTTSATPLDVWAPSGDYIKPQIADQYSVGYFNNFNNDKYALEIEAYYKNINNRIDYIDGADLIAQNHIETEILQGKSRSYGLELLLRKNLGRLTGWLSYTLSKSEQQTPGGDSGGLGINNGDWYNTAYDRTHDLSITGNYKLNDKWTFGANFIFQTGRPVTYPNGQFEYSGISIPTYSSRNAVRLPAYHHLDISATLHPRKNVNRNWEGEWVFSIYNLYNRSNAASISFGQNRETAVNEATRTSIFGLTPSVTYNFKF